MSLDKQGCVSVNAMVGDVVEEQGLVCLKTGQLVRATVKEVSGRAGPCP